MKLIQSLSLLVVFLLCPALSLPGVAQQPVHAALQTSATRRPAPSFKLRDAAGKTVALSALRGQVVALNLWATDCGGCKAELPTFVELHRTYKDQGLRVIGVSLDVMYEDLKTTAEGWARVTPFAREHGLAYTILVDDGSVEKAYKVMAMPATYLIDKRGRIAATYIGVVDSADLNANITALVAENP